MVEDHPISTRDQSRLHQFGKKVSPGTSLRYELYAGGIWKGYIMIADIEELEKMDAPEIFTSENQCERSVDTTKGEEFIFSKADGTAKLSGRGYEVREPTLRRKQTVRSEDLGGELQGEPGERQPTESTDDAEARADFWLVQGDFIDRHHNELRVQTLSTEGRNIPDSTEIH